MLKINETSLMSAKEQFEICNKVLLKEEVMLNEIRKELEGISGMEDQIGWLKRISNDIEQTQFKTATTIKVLNYAQMQYKGCENKVAFNSASKLLSATEGFRIVGPVNVYSPYLNNIKWKEGK
ncbi:MAG: hypothetical protein IJ927_06635 [Eubacterium sp.]|nr:hypothetical protein [Eubacterium sp.]